MRYAVICQDRWQVDVFTERVNNMLEKGWRLYEGLVVLQEDDEGSCLCQVLVKDTPEKES